MHQSPRMVPGQRSSSSSREPSPERRAGDHSIGGPIDRALRDFTAHLEALQAEFGEAWTQHVEHAELVIFRTLKTRAADMPGSGAQVVELLDWVGKDPEPSDAGREAKAPRVDIVQLACEAKALMSLGNQSSDDEQSSTEESSAEPSSDDDDSPLRVTVATLVHEGIPADTLPIFRAVLGEVKAFCSQRRRAEWCAAFVVEELNQCLNEPRDRRKLEQFELAFEAGETGALPSLDEVMDYLEAEEQRWLKVCEGRARNLVNITLPPHGGRSVERLRRAQTWFEGGKRFEWCGRFVIKELCSALEDPSEHDPLELFATAYDAGEEAAPASIGDAVARGMQLGKGKSKEAKPTTTTTTTTPPKDESGKGKLALSMSDLITHVEQDPEWMLAVDDSTERFEVFKVLEWMRAAPARQSACGLLLAGAAWKALGTHRREMDAYVRAVARETIPCLLATTTAQAIELGEHILLLETCLTPASMSRFSLWMLPKIIPVIDKLVAYCLAFGANIQSEADVDGFITLCVTEGADPKDYAQKPFARQLRNLHRFSKAALDMLDRHAGLDPTMDIGLIVYAGNDPNGGFVREPAVLETIMKLESFGLRVVMIEGQSMAAAAGLIRTLPGRVKQAMLVGHGNAQSIDMSTGKDGYDPLSPESANAKLMLDALERRLAPREVRIVLYGCLTGSTDLTLEPDPSMTTEALKHELMHKLIAQPSLVNLVSTMFDQAKVMGNHGAGANGHQRAWSDQKGMTFAAGQKTPKDERTVRGSKDSQASYGVEAEGVWRALLEVWARDTSPGHDALKSVVKARLAKRPGAGMFGCDLLLLQFKLIDDNNWYGDGAALRTLQRYARALSMLMGPANSFTATGIVQMFAPSAFGYDEHLALLLPYASQPNHGGLVIANLLAQQSRFNMFARLALKIALWPSMAEVMSYVSFAILPSSQVCAYLSTKVPEFGRMVFAAATIFSASAGADMKQAAAAYLGGPLEGTSEGEPLLGPLAVKLGTVGGLAWLRAQVKQLTGKGGPEVQTADATGATPKVALSSTSKRVKVLVAGAEMWVTPSYKIGEALFVGQVLRIFGETRGPNGVLYAFHYGGQVRFVDAHFVQVLAPEDAGRPAH